MDPSLSQVAALPKKKAIKDKDKSEPVEPKGFNELAADRMEKSLGLAAKARTQSISLEGVQYAGELSKQLLDHATKLEGHFKKLKEAVSTENTKKISLLLREAAALDEFGEKAKAGNRDGAFKALN